MKLNVHAAQDAVQTEQAQSPQAQPSRCGFAAGLGHRARQVCAVALILALQWQGLAVAADLSAQMAAMFGNGAMANVTNPGVYRSQTQSIYTGGEMQLRFPTRNYQLVSFSAPRFSAGCGGVDAYMGSFSHISGSQFRQMLESVAQGYEGLLFKAALKSITPTLESSINSIEKTLDTVNQYAGSTCKMAQLALQGTYMLGGESANDACISMQMAANDKDLAGAQKACKLGSADVNAQAKASSNPAIQELAQEDMNLVWKALSQTTFTKEEKEFFMNIAGTVILYAPANNDDKPKSPMPYDPSVDSLYVLLNGNESSGNGDQVVIKDWMKCPDADCLKPKRENTTITPFTTLVRQRLESIRDSIAGRTPLSPNDQAFIGMTSVPVYRMLSAAYTRDSTTQSQEMADVLIGRYAKVIAYDYAYAFLRTSLKDARMYINMAKAASRVEENQVRLLVSNTERLMSDIDSEHMKALSRVRDASALVDDLQRVERELRLSMPGSIRTMLQVTNMLRGGSGRGG